MEPTNQGEAPKLSQVIQIDEGKIQEHLGEVVRSTVEETLNAMLDAEADRLCRAERYERTEARKDTRAGSYQRQLQTKAGEVTLKVPKLRTLPFETAIIERYRRRESSVEEALVEMYLAGVSVRRVEDITEALWGTRVSPSTVSELNQKIYAQIEAWRNRPIEGKHPYVFLDGLWLKRSWGGEVRNVSLLVAIGVNDEGFREVLAVAEGSKEDKASWTAFLRHLKERGLQGVRLFVSDKCLGLVESLGEFYPEALWQQGEGSGSDAEGHSRTGRSRGGKTEGRTGGREIERDETGRCCSDCGGRDRRDAVLLRLSKRALALFAHEQSAGTAAARGATKNPCGRSVPGWEICADAGCGAFAPRGRLEVGHPALHGYESPGGNERSGMNTLAKNFRLPLRGAEHQTRLTPQSMCEKSWTLPICLCILKVVKRASAGIGF
jgi:Transposase, Mutator family